MVRPVHRRPRHVPDSDRVVRVIEETVRERFAGRHVARVIVTSDQDFDDEDVLTVRVVLDDTRRIEPSVSKSLVRHLRNALSEVDEHRFPVVRMMASSDLEAAADGR